MSKITNDGLTRSATGCFIAVPIWQQWPSKVLSRLSCFSIVLAVTRLFACSLIGPNNCQHSRYLQVNPVIFCVGLGDVACRSSAQHGGNRISASIISRSRLVAFVRNGRHSGRWHSPQVWLIVWQVISSYACRVCVFTGDILLVPKSVPYNEWLAL